MINNLDGKSARELRKIVQIQMDEYQRLQQANDEAQSLIGLLEAEIWKSKQEVIDSVNDLYGMMASTMKPMSMSECLDQIEQELNK